MVGKDDHHARKYPEEFRDDLVRVALNRDPNVTRSQVAMEFSIHVGTLGKRSYQVSVEQDEKQSVTLAENGNFYALRRRNTLLV